MNIINNQAIDMQKEFYQLLKHDTRFFDIKFIFLHRSRARTWINGFPCEFITRSMSSPIEITNLQENEIKKLQSEAFFRDLYELMWNGDETLTHDALLRSNDGFNVISNDINLTLDECTKVIGIEIEGRLRNAGTGQFHSSEQYQHLHFRCDFKLIKKPDEND